MLSLQIGESCQLRRINRKIKRSMASRLGKQALFLLLVGFFMMPSTGRAYVECADGMRCSSAAIAARDCCKPLACAEHSNHANDRRCIIKVSLPTVAVSSGHSADLIDLPPLAILPIAIATAQPTQTLQRVAIVHDLPPPYQPDPKQGNAPRSPPCDHV